MKKQTAVEWLVEQIRNDKFIKASDQIKLINKAKEMEKQQIIEASNESYLNSKLLSRTCKNKKVRSVGEQYYNETFK